MSMTVALQSGRLCITTGTASVLGAEGITEDMSGGSEIK